MTNRQRFERYVKTPKCQHSTDESQGKKLMMELEKLAADALPSGFVDCVGRVIELQQERYQILMVPDCKSPTMVLLQGVDTNAFHRIPMRSLGLALLSPSERNLLENRLYAEMLHQHRSAIGIGEKALGYKFMMQSQRWSEAKVQYEVIGLNPKRRSRPVVARTSIGDDLVSITVEHLRYMIEPKGRAEETLWECSNCDWREWIADGSVSRVAGGDYCEELECPRCRDSVWPGSCSSRYVGAHRKRAIAAGIYEFKGLPLARHHIPLYTLRRR